MSFEALSRLTEADFNRMKQDALKSTCRRCAAAKVGITDVPLVEMTWRQWNEFYVEYDAELVAAGLTSDPDAKAKIAQMAAEYPDMKPMALVA